jgi:hypothetical protein
MRNRRARGEGRPQIELLSGRSQRSGVRWQERRLTTSMTRVGRFVKCKIACSIQSIDNAVKDTAPRANNVPRRMRRWLGRPLLCLRVLSHHGIWIVTTIVVMNNCAR